ncbi:class I tRNA ligase family protein [Candidatus Vidania fulgoroideorum]
MINKYNFFLLKKKVYKLLIRTQKLYFKKNRKKIYFISMFPYPSGLLHLGHFRNYIINDMLCRYNLIKGYKSFMYFAWDSFGLPAENKSIEKKIKPKNWVESNIIEMKEQIKDMLLIINWKYEFKTSDVNYYKYNQLLFKNLFKKKYIYRRKSWVNWDKIDKTILADEQVIDGKGWRSGSKISKKLMYCYYFSTKKIFKRLLNYDYKNWPKKIIKLQKNWIGKNKFYLFKFVFNNKNFIFYTKYIKNLFFGNALLVSYENLKFLKNIIEKDIDIYKKIKKFVNSKKIYYDTGLYGYFFFIKKIKYKIILTKEYYSRYIILKNLYKFKIKNYLLKVYFRIFLKFKYFKKFLYYINKNIFFKKKYIFKLKDWSLSRQRYWGTPIPINKCKSCGYIIKFIPIKIEKLNKINLCYICNKKSIFEKETLDTFFDSSWYFIKYFVKKPFKKKFFLKEIKNYIGGEEHSILHLLYVIFIFIFLKKINICNLENPFKTITNHGILLNYSYYSIIKKKYISYEKINNFNGKLIIKLEKMSKSKKNGINPNILIKKYGIDCLRMYIFFACDIKDKINFNEKNILGIKRFIKKIWLFYIKLNFKRYNKNFKNYLDNEEKYKFKKIINNIIINYKKIKINVVISNLMIFLKNLKKILKIKKKIDFFMLDLLSKFISFLHPICPLLSYFLWMSTGIKELKGEIYDFNSFIKYKIKLKENIIIYINNKYFKKIHIKNKKIKKFIEKNFNLKIFKIIINKNICNILTKNIKR